MSWDFNSERTDPAMWKFEYRLLTFLSGGHEGAFLNPDDGILLNYDDKSSTFPSGGSD